MTIKEKIKRIWYIIRGKEYCYFDILIDKDELQEFKEFVAKIQEECYWVLQKNSEKK